MSLEILHKLRKRQDQNDKAHGFVSKINGSKINAGVQEKTSALFNLRHNKS